MAVKPRNHSQKSVGGVRRSGQQSGPSARVFPPDDRVNGAGVNGDGVDGAEKVDAGLREAPRKTPRQQRSKQMVEATLQAAAEVFAELGYAHATTNKIAQRAGVSVGSLYQYFPNKDSLLGSLLARHHADVHAVVDAALCRLADPETPLEDGLRRFFGELVAVHRANPALTRALSAAVLRQSPLADHVHHKDDGPAVESRRVSDLLALRPDVRDGDHQAMALVLSQTTSQLARWLVHDAPSSVDGDGLLEEVLQLLLRYLRR